MSKENVEIVRTYLKLWNAGDMEGVRELHDPDAVMEATPDWPEPGPFVGRDAVMQELNQVRDAFDRDSVEFLSDLVAMGARAHRRLEERLALRFPRALALVARATWMLPPRSRLRQALVRFAVRAGFDAINRGDYEPPFAFYDPAGELITPPQLVGLGFDPRYHGPEQRIAFQRKWVAEWGEFRAEVEEIIDLGDRVLLVGRIKGSGSSSGAAFDEPWADLLTVSAGRIVIERVFFDHGQALEAAGLRE